MIEKVNEFVSVIGGKTLNLTKEVVIRDLEGNQKVITKFYCTIVEDTSMNISVDVIDNEMYEKNIELIQSEKAKFIAECERLADENGVLVL